MQTHLGAISISSDKGCFPLSRVGDMLGGHLHEGSLCSAFRKMGEDEDFFLSLLLLNCLKLKVTLMPKWHTLGRQIFTPFTSYLMCNENHCQSCPPLFNAQGRTIHQRDREGERD